MVQSIHAHSMASTTPLTSTVRSSLSTHAHSSPLSLAARLPQCCRNFLIILTKAGLLPDRPCILFICALSLWLWTFYWKSHVIQCYLTDVCESKCENGTKERHREEKEEEGEEEGMNERGSKENILGFGFEPCVTCYFGFDKCYYIVFFCSHN